MILKPFWKVATLFGTRNLTDTLQRLLPGAYRDVLMYFDTVKPIVVITIDDGLSRGGPSTSMTKDVLDVLKKYDATATFFVCTDYVKGDEVEKDQDENKREDDDQMRTNIHSYLDENGDIALLFAQGHELGNHMQADLPFHYHKLKPQDFETKLKEAEDVLEEMRNFFDQNLTNRGSRCHSHSSVAYNEKFHKHDGANANENPTRWYRPPQGIMTTRMKESVDKIGLSPVLGDCYCDDWKFAQDIDGFMKVHEGDSNNDGKSSTKSKKLLDIRAGCMVMRDIGKIMLSQAQPGSIAIFHMPEKGFREGTIHALEEFLEGAQEQGWQCCSLTNAQLRIK